MLAAAGAYHMDFEPQISDRGEVVAIGPAGSFFYRERSGLLQLESNGRRITGFSPPPGSYDLVVRDSSGSLFVKGYFSVAGKTADIVKLRPDGSLAPDFQPHITEYYPPFADVFGSGITCLAPDGKGGCYVGGTFTSIDGKAVTNVTLFHLDQLGRLTTLASPAAPRVMARTSNGLFLGSPGALWLLPDAGEPIQVPPPTPVREWGHVQKLAFDPKFGLAVLADFPMETSGNSIPLSRTQCFAYAADGSLNSSFRQAVEFDVLTNAIAWDDAGRLLVSTYSALPVGVFESNPTRGLKRLLQDGRLDPTWSQTLSFDIPPSSVAVLTDGTIAAGGLFERVNGQPRRWLARLTADAQPGQRLSRHSARGLIAGQSQPLIIGFTVEGSTSVDVLVRGVGASLRQFGVTRVPATTLISIYRGNERLATATEFTVTRSARTVADAMGLFPSSPNAREAMLLISLTPGSYTAVIDAFMGDGGEVLGEVCYP